MLSRRPHTPLRPRLAVAALPVIAVVCAALLAACGGSSGGSSAPSPTSSAASSPAVASTSPTPVPSPVITSGEPPAAAVDVVRTFWTLVGKGRMDDARSAAIAPGSSLLAWTGNDIAAAKLKRVLYKVTPVSGATMTFGIDVWVKPHGVTPWGDTGTHTLFVSVVRMSDGSWRMWDVSTSP